MASKVLVLIIGTLLVLAVHLGWAWAADSQGQQTKGPLRLGMESTKAVEDLGQYSSGVRSGIGDYADSVAQRTSIISLVPDKPAFNLSQRTGQVGRFTHNASLYRPLFNTSDYTRTKPMVAIPESSRQELLYNVSNYPEMMMAASIP
jgi:hypothetical protein